MGWDSNLHLSDGVLILYLEGNYIVRKPGSVERVTDLRNNLTLYVILIILEYKNII